MLSLDCHIALCFALPLPDYEVSCSNVKWQMENKVAVVPNKYDSDLLKPYFWIELTLPGNDDEVYVIDPVVHLNEREMVAKYKINEAISNFTPSNDLKINMNQRFRYVVSIDTTSGIISDFSPRYIKNLCYRYFDEAQSDRTSKNCKSYYFFKKLLNRVNKGVNNASCSQLMKLVAQKNFQLPESLSALKKSDNFIVPSLLRSTEIISSDAQPISYLTHTNVNSGKKTREPIFWKSAVLRLKSRQHWAILSRSIREDVKPLKWKKHIPLKNRRLLKMERYEIKELYSFDQTIPTPKLSNEYRAPDGTTKKITDPNFYRNKFKHVEIYSERVKPDGFVFVYLHEEYDVKVIINRFNKMAKKARHLEETIKYVEVVDGFDFKQRPGYAVPIINKLMINADDSSKVDSLIDAENERTGLSMWAQLLKKMQLKQTLNLRYGDADNDKSGN